ncbi:condensin-2 complex subunit D3-like [Odontomachus brunneus]|uniref:condensin-2 complex subunit D3-like n=1 Tax=Odontomachus brunneus TaxID=486640 RepID=UPI0013F180CC|nr:condensin-2 complex subunit D3-like [Odontomachus brunneus]
MESLRVFHKFNLDILDEAWIKSVWDAEFTTYKEPPDNYLEYLESDEAQSVLRTCCQDLKKWITANREQQESEFSWQTLMMLDINVQGLLAVLDYIMKTGQRVSADEAPRQACLEATRLYLMLLTVPGSNAFRVYHPNLYERVMDTLRISENIFSSENNVKETDINCSNDDDKLDHCMMSYFEKLKVLDKIKDIISDLITMLQSFGLKHHTDSLKITIRTLLDITKLGIYTKVHNINTQLSNMVSSLCKVAFMALEKLCSNNHGHITLTIMLIAQCMLPYLLSYNTNNYSAKSMAVVQESFIYFLKDLLQDNTNKATQAVVTLMHQLMTNCPERVEIRQKQAVNVIKLLNICDKNVTLQLLEDIILFSFNSKVSCRLFAQEIIGKLLTEHTLSYDNLGKDMKIRIRKILVAVVLSRCMDRSPLVKGRAMATFALFSDCNHDDVDRDILKGMFEAADANKQLLTLKELIKALVENTDPLPGSDTLIAMLLDRLNDERALVRRSGLKILQNLTVMVPSLVKRTINAITERCRDSTLMVRQFAVHVLSEILGHFPHDPNLLHEWVQAVMPQIYDVESKVQEKVLECLQDILINRITCASTYKPNDANSLPWRILDKLSNMRMRKHLSKACSLWVKNGIVTKSVILNLQSHLGTNNTIGAWILLAALAENMKIPRMELYIADYKDVICKNDFHASLVLHVIRHAYSCLDRDNLEELHQYLYKRICHFEIKFNLISVCLDIVSNVLQYLYHSKSCVETYMAELIKLSETELQDILKDDEGDTQDTLKMRAIFTLGHASLLCTDRISSSSLRILQKLLLDPKSLPQAVRETKGLKTSAVVLLCQQALRDRDIAKKVTPIFGTLMRQETDSPEGIAVKVNAAKALADICVRFTALVEPYLLDMCISTKDPNPAVREAIVVIFIQLLLEDFIKMKGPFFFHILTMLSDPDSMIRELTIFLVEERLLRKNKTLISQQFLESIYYYNNYHSQSTLCGYRMRDREKKLLMLPGKANEEKRNIIYEFMLDHLDSPAKFKLTVKLTKYILCEICDGKSIDVEKEEGACVLQDTLFIMGNNRLELKKHTDDPSELDETTNPFEQSTSTTTNSSNAMAIILAELKKHHLDSLLPTLIRLKEKFNTSKSPLKNNVERLLHKVYSNYNKEHLISLLNEYPELEKDMDRYHRKLKDKITSENDDDDGSSRKAHTINHKDSDVCKRTPVPSTSWTPDNTYDKLSPSSRSQDPSSCDKLFSNVSVRLEKLSLTKLSSESTVSISTPPRLAQNLSPSTSYSSTCVLQIKRPSSELGMPLFSSPRKTSRRSVSRW